MNADSTSPSPSTTAAAPTGARHSRARSTTQLRGFVLDAVAEALHSRAALRGARLSLQLVLSRRCMALTPGQLRELETLSGELRALAVPHGIHCVARGDAEPAQHALHLHFSTVGQNAPGAP